MELSVPYDVEKRPQEKKFTYLDTSGRPVVVARKQNLVEQHIQEFEVGPGEHRPVLTSLQLRYRFSSLRLLQEPLLVVAALYVIFLSVIIVVRLDFSISKVGDVGGRASGRAGLAVQSGWRAAFAANWKLGCRTKRLRASSAWPGCWRSCRECRTAAAPSTRRTTTPSTSSRAARTRRVSWRTARRWTWTTRR